MLKVEYGIIISPEELYSWKFVFLQLVGKVKLLNIVKLMEFMKIEDITKLSSKGQN